MNILLIRLDKIGDLVCTLCVDQVLQCKNSEAHDEAHNDIQWLVSEGMKPILESSVPPRKGWYFSKKFSFSQVWQLWQHLKKTNFQMAISFQGPWWVSFLLWLDQVPLRAGVLSQWHSFLFLNCGLRQKRSLAMKHESDYNLELLKHALQKAQRRLGTGKNLNSVSTTPILTLKSSTPIPPDLPASYLLVHPGMAGSALNWPIEYYQELILKLSKQHNVVITGTAMDRPWTDPLQKELDSVSNIFFRVEAYDLNQLLSVLQKALVVIAPSTGVLHLAASLGRPVVGFYSPIQVHRSVRWGPRSIEDQKIVILEPQDNLHSDPMRLLSVDQAYLKIQDLLKKHYA